MINDDIIAGKIPVSVFRNEAVGRLFYFLGGWPSKKVSMQKSVGKLKRI